MGVTRVGAVDKATFEAIPWVKELGTAMGTGPVPLCHVLRENGLLHSRGRLS